MKNKIRSFIDQLIRSKQKAILLAGTLPVFVVVAYLFLLEQTGSNLFALVVFVLSYYMLVFTLFLTLYRAIPPENLARSPFYFIKQLHTTGNRDYWDEYQQPTRHLIGAEIGVYGGNNALEILNFLNIRELVLVDPWKGYLDVVIEKGEDDSFYEGLFNQVSAKFSHDPRVRIIRDISLNAATMFDDDYFDFIYLDGDHSYESVFADLTAWYPKLKKFGVMCGDDFGHPSGVGVIEAVTKFAYQNQLLTQNGPLNQFWFVKV